MSKTVYVTSGVPQGCHLGHLLFLWFLNNLPCDISDCNILVYADDVNLFYTFGNDNGQAVLQRNIDLFVTWCRTNLMDINLRKISRGRNSVHLIDLFFPFGNCDYFS